MKLQILIVLASVCSANAQILVPLIFNRLSSRLVSVFNNFFSSSLESYDPFALDYGNTIPLGTFEVPNCGTATSAITYEVGDLVGLSTAQLDVIEMTDFSSESAGFSASGSISSIQASITGELTSNACGQTISESFTGTAIMEGQKLSMAFESTIGTFPFALQDVTVSDFTLAWDKMEVDLDGIEDFESALDEIVDTLIGAVETAADTLVNKELLQSAIDPFLPLEISGFAGRLISIFLVIFG